jgi:hypothetical protein
MVTTSDGTSLRAFFASRWRGQVLLERIFWRDMLLVGTLINLATAMLALLILAAGAPAPIAITVYLAPLPYNFLLYVGVWTAAAQAVPAKATTVRFIATLWVAASVLI